MDKLNIEEKSSVLSIKDNICFLELNDIGELLSRKSKVDEIIDNNNILSFIVIVPSSNSDVNLNNTMKEDLYKWISTMNIITVISVNGCYTGDLLEVGMMFDIRLGGKDIEVVFPKDVSNYVFNFYDKCDLVMGKRIKNSNYKELLGTTLKIGCKYFDNFINKVIESEDCIEGTWNYIHSILKNKDEFQIRAIMSCFKHYSKLGLNSERSKLIEEEKKQFHILVAKSKK